MIGARLEVRRLAKHFGGIEVLRSIDLDLAPGERRWISGLNGAGKSTLLDLIAGAQTADRGTIRVDDVSIDRLAVRHRADLGIARNWQLPQVFNGFTVGEQIQAALELKRGRRYRLAPMRAYGQKIRELAARFDLREQLDAYPDELAHAQRRLLDIALALATPAKLILLDEPSAGLSRHEARALFARLRELTAESSVLIVEHDHQLANEFADSMSMLHDGLLTEPSPTPSRPMCAESDGA